ncbi:zinc finger protein 883-like [Culicoides brevitarsis]|uniref:zinc finger protein 883-like n=1 Tax=Culicoides brevitarsis TaxID=469753 RepID=UPI00307BAE1B
MGSPIEFVAQCIACLSENVENVKSNPNLAKIYEELIQEQITEKLHENSYIFCISCENHLNTFQKFKETCKESWKKLANHFADDWERQLEKIFCDSPMQQEIIIDNQLKNDDEEVFLVDSDSEASTIPPEEPNQELEDVTMIKFEAKSDENESSCMEESDEKLKKRKKTHRESLVTRGLLPKRENISVSICNVCHISSKDIKTHYITAHTTEELDEYICSNCTIVHKTQEKIIKHIKNYHTFYLKPRKCTFCDATFIESGEYRRHFTSHQIDYSNHVCNICGKLERNNSTLQVHINRVHKGYHQCRHCTKMFGDSEEFYNHLKWEMEKRQAKEKNTEITLVCDICGFKTRIKDELTQHTVDFHKIPKRKELSCEVCDKKFINSDHLANHVRIMHKKKYKCTECDFLFGSLTDMRDHYEREHGENSSPSTKPMPLQKKMMNAEVKTFECNVCDKAFKQRMMLKIHMYKHTGFRPFYCNLCNRGFYDRPMVEKHFLKEHGAKVSRDYINSVCRNKSMDES